MEISVRPQTKFAAAMLAAAVVAAGPIVTMPVPDAALMVTTAEVQPASFITDALANAGLVVGGVVSIIESPVQVIASLPSFAVAALVTSLQNPSAIGSELSFLAQLYLNPAYLDYTLYTASYPAAFIQNGLQLILYALPDTLRNPIFDALNDIALAIGGAFSALPDPAVGANLITQFRNHDVVASLIRAAVAVVTIPVYAVGDVVRWIGSVPATLEGSLESALKNPTDIPGLVNYLVDTVVDLAQTLTLDIAAPLTRLPGPIGYTYGDTNIPLDYGAVDGAITAAYTGLRNVLAAVFGGVTPPPSFLLKTAKVRPATTTFDTQAVTKIPSVDATSLTVDLPVVDALRTKVVEGKAALEKLVHKPAVAVTPPADVQPAGDPDPISTLVVDQTGPADSAPNIEPGKAFTQSLRGKLAEVRTKLTKDLKSLRPTRETKANTNSDNANSDKAESANVKPAGNTPAGKLGKLKKRHSHAAAAA